MKKEILLCIFLLLFFTGPASASEKGSTLQMTSTLENSDTQLQFNYAENIGDGRGITFGVCGFCTGTYDGNILIKHYTKLNPDNTLAKYIPAMDKIDAGSHNAAGGDGNPSVTGLDGFIKDVQNCNDPLFKQAQIDMLDELYYNPAMKLADSIGAKNALTRAFIYDMCVRHGPDDAKHIIDDAGTTPKQGADENAYLLKLLSLRDAKLKQEGLGDVNRDQGYKNILSSGNVGLVTPFKFVAYGDSFTIDDIPVVVPDPVGPPEPVEIETPTSVTDTGTLTIYKTPLGAGTPPATQCLTGGGNSIDYTAVPASSTDPTLVQFKDLSKGTETYISWEFGDGTYLTGTEITPQLKNPVHKFPKTGYYIGGLTIRCTGYNGFLWVHKTVIIKAGGTVEEIPVVDEPVIEEEPVIDEGTEEEEITEDECVSERIHKHSERRHRDYKRHYSGRHNRR